MTIIKVVVANTRATLLWLLHLMAVAATSSMLTTQTAVASDIGKSVGGAARTLIGNPPQLSLRASSDAAITLQLNELTKRAIEKGIVRVIVGLRVGFAPEGRLAVSDASTQRDEITTMQSELLRTVLPKRADSVKRYQFIPFLALEVDAAELEALANLVSVTSILEDTASPPLLENSVPLIGGTAAWAMGYSGAGQTIAILDTGVDKTHPFLAGKVVSEACFSSNLCPGGSTQTTAVGSGVPCPSSISGCGHGTFVAGVAAGKGIARSGVAKDATLIAVQVFHRQDNQATCAAAKKPAPCAQTYASDYMLGLEHIYSLKGSFNIASANMSLGGDRYYSNCDSEKLGIKGIIDNLRSVGIATVIASGNEHYKDSLASPACISTAISVGSSGFSDAEFVSNFSNSAAFLSLLAPGDSINSSAPGGTYTYGGSGTSYAAPHVAGALAVLKQKRPSLSVDEALTVLTKTGVEIKDTNDIVTPRIQINEALNIIRAYPPLTTLSSCVGQGSVEGVRAWGPTADLCWGVSSWGSFIADSRSLPARWCMCRGHGGVEGVGLWGPEGSACAGIPSWGTHNSDCVDLSTKDVCACTGHGGVEGLTMWGPSGAACAGIPAWGTHSQSCAALATAGTLPEAPEIGAVTYGNATAFVGFTPRSIGSGFLSTYVADCGGIASTAMQSPIAVTGLAPGTTYTCKVKASTTVGDSGWSAVSNATTTPARLAWCTGQGGVSGVQMWGPDGSDCWGVSTWEKTKRGPRSLPARWCMCTGHGGVEGVGLWGPEGEKCGGADTWGTYDTACTDLSTTSVCACAGHGGVEGLTMWAPNGSACGGIAAWGAHNQRCFPTIQLPDARYPINVDADSSPAKYEARTDGTLLLRYLLGVRGAALINAAIGIDAIRYTPEHVAAYLGNILPALDVDRNGRADALTDGLLVLRYLIGLRGSALTQGAVGAGATRSVPTQVENYIRTLSP